MKNELLSAALAHIVTNVEQDEHLRGVYDNLDDWKDTVRATDLPIQQLAGLQNQLADLLATADTIKKELQKAHDFLAYSYIPGVMEEMGVENIRVVGVGTLYLSSDVRVSIPADHKQQAYDWLRDTNRASLIQQTVNASTLKAAVKQWMRKGESVPDDLFKVTPYTVARIKTK